jgi:hypothetical protein
LAFGHFSCSLAEFPKINAEVQPRRNRCWTKTCCGYGQGFLFGKPMPELQVPRGITPEVRVGVGV